MKLLKLLTVALSVLFFSVSANAGDKLKVGFIYVGPTGDHGWTYRHDIGRQDVEKHFGDKVVTKFIESVPEGPDAERVMRSMAMEGMDIIFATSFGYMNQMVKVAKEFPDVKFEHATGYKQGPNLSTYGLRLYQARHVQGVIAGMMTKTNKICYVAAFPIPEVIREINTYYLGAKSVNPDVKIDIIWVNTWYNPVKEGEAAKVLITQGCDMVAQHTDSPSPLQVAQKEGVFGFGQASDQIRFAPKAQLTATIDDWGPYYIDRVQAVMDGNWNSGDYFGGMIDDDAVGMAPFTNMPADVEAFATKIKEGIKNGKYHAFTGPIKDNTGKLQLKDGEIASDVHLNTMMYYVEGIDAKVPGS
ncbi:BMP family ABC transporter substrate-binding protein [bacterium]|nr:BMP family ABC transporter substrate-binding protein [bacterium]